MRKRIIYLDLEDLPQRYTGMMNQAVKKVVDIVISGKEFPDKVIKVGQFLDVNRTIGYKASQMQKVSEMFERGEVKGGDVFLIGDIFFPGIESIQYMAQLQGIQVSVCGFNYAGRADSTDFVRNLGAWADTCELGYHKVCDLVFVGSEFHRQQVLNHFVGLAPSRVKVTGYVYDRDYIRNTYQAPGVEKVDQIIWPHRPCSEKGLGDLLQFVDSYAKHEVVITTCGPATEVGLELGTYEGITYKHSLTKAQYYEELAKSKFYLSTAYQETFGYTLQEAIHYGCRIAAPWRACYPEMIPEGCLYKHLDEIYDCWERKAPDPAWTEKWNNNIYKVVDLISEMK